MTTLAIIGGGIAGRSLIYALAKKKNSFSKVILFDSDQFAPTCSLRSTAVVAPRGITTGHSELGDLLSASFLKFKQHVEKEKPSGVHPIVQKTFATSKVDAFIKRYPQHSLKDGVYSSIENGFLIETKTYLNWLLEKSRDLSFEVKNGFVINIEHKDELVELKLNNGEVFQAHKVIIAAGSYNRFWRGLSPAKPLSSSAPVQGAYLEFLDVDYGPLSFSITFDGDNFVYHAHSHILLIGSSTQQVGHELPPVKDLSRIYERLRLNLNFELPPFEKAIKITGQREKASQRKPYIIHEGALSWIGGFYKNGYSLGLELAERMVDEL